MEYVIVERVFDQPMEPAQIEANMQAAQGCLTALRVRHVRTYVSLDGRRMICEYEAPDAEAVRAVSQRLAIPYERLWTARLIPSEDLR